MVQDPHVRTWGSHGVGTKGPESRGRLWVDVGCLCPSGKGGKRKGMVERKEEIKMKARAC